jgi:hypothetical protein
MVCHVLLCFFETGSHSIAQTGLKLRIVLHVPPAFKFLLKFPVDFFHFTFSYFVKLFINHLKNINGIQLTQMVSGDDCFFLFS